MTKASATNGTAREAGPGGKVRSYRMLHMPRLVVSLAVIAVVVPAAYFWHARQLRHIVDDFRQRADALEKTGDAEKAAEYLHRYLQLHPEDASAQAKLAEVYVQAARSPEQRSRAVQLFYLALGKASAAEQVQLRRRLARLLVDVGRYAEAETEVRKLLQAEPKDPEGNRLLALALYRKPPAGQTRSKEAGGPAVADVFVQALTLDPTNVELAAILARIYRQQDQFLGDLARKLPAEQRSKLADEVFDRLVSAAPKSDEAHLARFAYRTEFHLAGAGEDLQKALALGPDNLTGLLYAAHYARQEKNDLATARRHMQRFVELAPKDERGYLALGTLYAGDRDLPHALATWRRGLEACGKTSVALNIRLAEGLIAAGQLDEADEVLHAIDTLSKQLSPRLAPSERLMLDRTSDILRARWWLTKGETAQAMPLLQRVTAGPRTTPLELQQTLEAWQLLGNSYAAALEWDSAGAAYEQALALQPASVPLLQAAAKAWLSGDRPDKAIRYWEQALARDDSAETWLGLAQAQFRAQYRRPQKERDWGEFRKALAAAGDPAHKGPLSAPWQLTLLGADFAAAEAEEQGDPEKGHVQAAILFHEAEDKSPDNQSLLATLALSYQRVGQPGEADRVVGRLEKLCPDLPVAYLLRARLCAQRRQYDKADEALQQGIRRVPAKSRVILEQQAVQISLEWGKFDRAAEQLAKLYENDPANLVVLRQLVEMSLQLGKIKDAERWETTLRAREGEEGLYWRYYQARRLVALAKENDKNLAEAAELAATIQSRRPAWPLAHLLNGLIHERRGNVNEAINAFQAAIQSGEQRPFVHERLISLLMKAGRTEEAQQHLSQLQQRGETSENLSLLELSLAAQQGKLDRAIDLANQRTKRRPNDPVAEIQRGLMLAKQSGPKAAEEAEAAFQRAFELAPEMPQAFGALFNHYLRAKQPDRARELLEKFAVGPKLKAQRPFILAQGYEMLGDRKTAEQYYREAEKATPDNVELQLRVAAFYLRTDPAAAEKPLRRALELAPESGQARRTLAAILAGRGGEGDWEESQRLLGPGKNTSATASELTQRLQAILLAGRMGRAHQAKARQLLEELVADEKHASPGDRLLLAQMYEAEGKFDAARTQCLALLGQANPDPAHIAIYVDLLLRHGMYDEATLWLQKLEKLAPDNLTTVRLKAAWLQAHGQLAEIEPAVEHVAEEFLRKAGDDQAAKVQLCAQVGAIYTSVDQHAVAERWYRRLMELDAKQYAPLVMSLAQQGRMKEAVAMCLEVAKSDASAAPAAALAMALSQGHPQPAEFEMAEPLLAKSLAEHKEDADLLLGAATLRTLQGRLEDAIQMYQRVLKLRPNDAMALNNLATLWAEIPEKRPLALQRVEQAIDVGGPQAVLLDTKGTILLYDGKPRDAVPVLEAATAGPHPAPLHELHLALAYFRTGQTIQAKTTLKQAQSHHLDQQFLTPTEKRLLAELEENLRESKNDPAPKKG